VGTSGKGVFISTNAGLSWGPYNSGLTNTYVNALAVSGTNLFAGTSNGIFFSTNNDISWTAADEGLTSPDVLALAVYGTSLFAGTRNGVFLLTDNSESWTSVNEGLLKDREDSTKYSFVYALGVSDKYLFAAPGNFMMDCGTAGTGLWRRPLSELVGVTKEGSDLPLEFTLSQNYPNPFNPSTTIRYQLPIRSIVTIKMYNILGKEITTLVNEKKDAGKYSINFNGSSLPSGVYFYRIQAGSFAETKKMMLLK
jgi:hypothetical protein